MDHPFSPVSGRSLLEQRCYTCFGFALKRIDPSTPPIVLWRTHRTSRPPIFLWRTHAALSL